MGIPGEGIVTCFALLCPGPPCPTIMHTLHLVPGPVVQLCWSLFAADAGVEGLDGSLWLLLAGAFQPENLDEKD